MYDDNIELGPIAGPSRSSERVEIGPQEHARGHFYSQNYIRDHARVRFGDVYNYRNSESSERNVLDWLTSLNPSESHSQACQKYQEGTLEWFFADSRFEEWRDGLESLTPCTLWCRGTIGPGKTVLAAQILNRIQAARASTGYLAVVYCRYPERKIQTLENILGSILAQLCQHDEGGFDMPPYIQAAHESQSRFWTRRPSVQQLSDWLHQKLDSGRSSYIILDALDELETPCRHKLLRILQGLPHVSLKLLVTSRDLPEIGAELLNTSSIMVRASKQDLTTLTHARLREAALASGSVEQSETFASVEQEILSKIIGLANNTFLLASIYLDRIVTCTKIEDITHHLTTLPLTLDAHYDEAWERCTGASDVLRSHRAKLILMWIMTIGCVCVFAGFIVSSSRLPATATSLAEYGAISMSRHARESSSATKLKVCLRMGQASLLYGGLVLMWAWPVALSGFVSASIGLPVSMNVSKVWPRIAWDFCLIMCSSGIVGVAVSFPGRRCTVVRLGVFAYHVFLRCALLLLFVKAK